MTQLTRVSEEDRIFEELRLPTAGQRRARAMEGAMLKVILYSKSASRIEIDQRARDARLRLEQIERLLASRALP